MSKFKVGDRVRAIRDYRVVKSGMVGTVKSVYCSDPPIGVEWDTLTDGHDGNGCGMKCECGKGYYVEEANIELLRLPSIHITTDGNTATATIEQNNTEYKVSTEFACYKSVKAATQAALDKAWNLANGKSTVRSVREVKRPAKVGEYIKIIAPISSLGQYGCGDVLQVKEAYPDKSGYVPHVKAIGVDITINDSEYVVLEGYTPEQEKPKYYNGKVVCVKAGLGFTAGKVYAFENGQVVDDDGDIRPGDWTIGRLEDYHPTVRFIEYKGEA